MSFEIALLDIFTREGDCEIGASKRVTVSPGDGYKQFMMSNTVTSKIMRG